MMHRSAQLKLNFLCCCLIVLIGGLIYVNSLNNPFVYDDERCIVRNNAIHHLSDLRKIASFQPRRWVGTWTFACNYAFGGLDVRGYHVVNILIHIGSGLIVWWLCYLILSAPQFCAMPIASEKEKLSLWVALLFIVHPVQTMAVDHITQRYAALAAFFYLISLGLYLKARLMQGKAQWFLFAASCLAGFLSIFTREAAVTLPLAVVFCEGFIFGGFGKCSFGNRKYWLLAAGGGFTAAIVLLFYRLDIVGLLTGEHYYSQSHQGETFSAVNYLLTQFRVILVYIRLLFWPVLNFDYDFSVSRSFWEPGVLAGFLSVVLLWIAAVRVRTRYPFVSLGIYWFFLTLMVESTFFPIAYMITEYRLYLPLFGFCLGFVSALRTLIRDRRAFTVLMGIIVLVFSVMTIYRNRVYRDDVSLWSDTVKKSPDKSRPYTNLGAAFIHIGEYALAQKSLQKAVTLDPDNYEAFSDLAVVSVKTGQLDKAIAIDKKLARIKPSASVFNNLGVIYSKKGDLNNALMYFNKALSLDYSFNEANFNKANILWRKGRFKQAEHIYFSEISKYPGEYRARYALIQMYLETKQELAAIRASKDVLASQNNDPEGLVGLGAMFASRRYPQEALGFFIKALSVDDAFSEAYIHMGQLLFDQGKQEEALRVWQKGLEHCPNNVQLRKMIADVDTVRRLR